MSKTILADVDGWTPLIDSIVQNHGIITAAVFGKVWRYCQMEDKVCKASQQRIADELDLSRIAINTHIDTLCKNGYILDTTPDVVGIPHIYADTGKAGLSISFTAFSQPVNDVNRGCKPGLQGGVNDVNTKKEVKKEKETDRDTQVEKTFQPSQTTRRTQAKTKGDMMAGILNNEAQIQGKSWTLFPEPFHPLARAFCEETSLAYSKNISSDWIETFSEWMNIGYSPDEVRSAVKSMMIEGKGGWISRPGSIDVKLRGLRVEKFAKDSGLSTEKRAPRGYQPRQSLQDVQRELQEWTTERKANGYE